MGFEWDLAKNRANVEKHGVDFMDAVHVFEGPTLESADRRKNYGETRILAVGVADGHYVTVIYTIRGPNHRLISARRSSRNERKAYRAFLLDAAETRKN